MTPRDAAVDLLHAQIADPDTQWSLGTFDGLAEFAGDCDEKVLLTQSASGAGAVGPAVRLEAEALLLAAGRGDVKEGAQPIQLKQAALTR